MGCDEKTGPSKFFLKKMREGCFRTRLAFVSRLRTACSIGVVPCSSFGLSSGLIVVSGCAWSGSGAWSSEWFSGSVAGSRMALARTLLRLSLHAPGAHMCPSYGFTCLRLQEKMCLRWWPHTCVEKSKTFVSDPKFSDLWRPAFMAEVLRLVDDFDVPVQNRFLKLRSYQLLSCSSKPPRLRQVIDCPCIFKPNQCVTSFSFNESSYSNCFIDSEASHH